MSNKTVTRKHFEWYELKIPSMNIRADIKVEEPEEDDVTNRFVDRTTHFAHSMLLLAIAATICDSIYQITNWAIHLQ